MRNWNKDREHYHMILFIVYRVPMRNWNMRRMVKCLSGNPSLSRTYEELKQHIHYPNISLSYFVYRVPMRNWNVNHQYWMVVLFNGLSRTYEELKHKKASWFFWSRKEFIAYLWGIETGLETDSISFYSWFIAYLWGIET